MGKIIDMSGKCHSAFNPAREGPRPQMPSSGLQNVNGFLPSFDKRESGLCLCMILKQMSGSHFTVPPSFSSPRDAASASTTTLTAVPYWQITDDRKNVDGLPGKRFKKL